MLWRMNTRGIAKPKSLSGLLALMNAQAKEFCFIRLGINIL